MKYAFIMQLLTGFESEYKKRHDEIWPELSELLKAYGIADYSISLEPQSLQLFAIFTANEDFDGEGLKVEPIMQRWWEYMSPLMETLPETHEPKVTALLPVFYLE